MRPNYWEGRHGRSSRLVTSGSSPEDVEEEGSEAVRERGSESEMVLVVLRCSVSTVNIRLQAVQEVLDLERTGGCGGGGERGGEGEGERERDGVDVAIGVWLAGDLV